MRILPLNQGDTLFEVETALRSGKICIIPTDTVYGIVGDARNESVIKKVFDLKNRPEDKAFPIFVSDIPTARQYAYISDAKANFLAGIWPGKVTVVFQHKEKLPSVLTGEKNTIGIRIPDHPFVIRLLSQIDFPLFQTSANTSTLAPAKNRDEVLNYFKKDNTDIEITVDGGVLPGTSSTVIDYTGEHHIILRSGVVSKADLARLVEL